MKKLSFAFAAHFSPKHSVRGRLLLRYCLEVVTWSGFLKIEKLWNGLKSKSDQCKTDMIS